MSPASFPANGGQAPITLMLSEPWTWDRPHPDDPSRTHLEYQVDLVRELGADGLEIFPWNFSGVMDDEIPANKVSAFSRERLRWALDQLPAPEYYHVVRIFGQAQGQVSTFPWGSLRTENPHMQRVAVAVGERRHVMYSLGIDPWEWVPGDREVTDFFRWVSTVDPMGDERLWGVRTHPERAVPRPGPVAMPGWVMPAHDTGSIRRELQAMIRWAGGKPLYADDRFRVGGDIGTRDFGSQTALARMVALARQENVGLSIGILRGQGRARAHGRGMRRPDDVAGFQRAFRGELPGDDSGGPAFDLNAVNWLHADISGWEQTSQVESVEITDDQICIRHSRAGQWPVWKGPGGNVEGNPWVFVNRGGRWFGATYEWLRPGQTCKGITADNIGPHIKVKPLDSWQPKPGELVGFAVSTIARGTERTSNERSNVVLVAWPGGEPGPDPDPEPVPEGDGPDIATPLLDLANRIYVARRLQAIAGELEELGMDAFDPAVIRRVREYASVRFGEGRGHAALIEDRIKAGGEP